jgi:formamidopyrimidine-DNA glycosylase
MQCLPDSAVQNAYQSMAHKKPSPLTEAFTLDYFKAMAMDAKARTMSAKAFLATEQRIPGLGNGVLQDILFNSELNPKRKIETLSDSELEKLYRCVRHTLADMAGKGGRDTENDLYGLPGGYASVLSRNTVGTACPRCGGTIVKEAYMGGSVYYCPGCQRK